MIGNTIKEIRKSRGYKQKEFAKVLKLTPAYYNTIENGSLPSIKILKRIAGALEVTVPVLFLHSVDRESVPDNKKEHYDIIIPTIKDLIMSLY